MNKLFSKIAALSVGLAMAVGVGVAVGHEAFREARADYSFSGSKITFANQSLENSVQYLDPFTSEVFTIQFAGGANDGKYYTTGSGMRTYGGGSFTVTSVSGNISQIAFTWDGTNKPTTNVASVGTLSNDGLTWEGDSNSVTFSRPSGSGHWRLKTVEVTIGPSLPSLTIKNSSGETGPFTNLNAKSLGGFMFYAYDESTQKAVTFSINDSVRATLQDNEDGSCCVYPKHPGTITLTAELSGYTTTNASLTFVYEYDHAGTAEDPFTVAEGIEKSYEIGATAAGPWVTKGLICKKTAWDSRYTNVTYWISDSGEDENTIQCHRGKYLEGADVTADNEGEFALGKLVTVTGNLLLYSGNTPEYAANNYPLSIETPSSGDVDVVFTPDTSIEIYDTGTFTATSNTAGAVFTWAVDKPEILSVNETTGEYEALAYGSAKVTVTATAGDKSGTAFAVIIVNGSSYSFLDVTDAIDIASKLESGKTTEYYVCFAGYVKEFATSKGTGDKPRAFDIQNERQDASIMVYTNVDPYEAFVDGLQLGTLVRIKANIQNYNGTYELVAPVKLYTEYVAMTFAYELLDETDKVCKDYDGVTNNHDAIEAIWTSMKPKYEALNDAQKGRLINPSLYSTGETVVNAMERYDYLTGKYDLENFITGRTPVVFSTVNSQFNENNSSSTIIIVIASISVLSFGLALALRKKRTK